MHQIGASAAGGSAAGAAGKGVSDGLDAMGGVLSKAAKTGDKEKKKGRRAPFLPPEPSLPSAKKNATPSQEPAPAFAQPQLAPARTSVMRPQNSRTAGLPAGAAALPSSAEAKPQPLSATLPQMELGASRSEVVQRLGKPAGRITSIDDQGLVEVYSFREGRTPVGSVRLVNGRVAEVKIVQ